MPQRKRRRRCKALSQQRRAAFPCCPSTRAESDPTIVRKLPGEGIESEGGSTDVSPSSHHLAAAGRRVYCVPLINHPSYCTQNKKPKQKTVPTPMLSTLDPKESPELHNERLSSSVPRSLFPLKPLLQPWSPASSPRSPYPHIGTGTPEAHPHQDPPSPTASSAPAP